MHGPDHYEAAEHLLDSTQDQAGNHQASPNLTAALVHAVLALAAATALNDTDPNGDGMPPDDCDAWQYIAGVSSSRNREDHDS